MGSHPLNDAQSCTCDYGGPDPDCPDHGVTEQFYLDEHRRTHPVYRDDCVNCVWVQTMMILEMLHRLRGLSG